MSSQITLAAPRLGAEEGVGRTRKYKKIEANIKPNTCTEPTPKAEETPGEGRGVSSPAPKPTKKGRKLSSAAAA